MTAFASSSLGADGVTDTQTARALAAERQAAQRSAAANRQGAEFALSGDSPLAGTEGTVGRIQLQVPSPGTFRPGEVIVTQFVIDVKLRPSGSDASSIGSPAAAAQTQPSNGLASSLVVGFDPEFVELVEGPSVREVETGAGEAQLRGSFAVTLREPTDWTRRVFGGTVRAVVSLAERRSGVRSSVLLTGQAGPDWSLFAGAAAALALYGAAFVVGMRWLRRRREALFHASFRDHDDPYPGFGRDGSQPPSSESFSAREFLPDLVNALCDDRAILVLGSGAPAQAGLPRGMEIASQLARTFARQLPSGLNFLLGGHVGARVAEGSRAPVYSGAMGRLMDFILSSVDRGQVIEQIRKAYAVRPAYQGFHAKLAAMPWRASISFGWDELFENAVRSGRSKTEWLTFVPSDAGELSNAIRLAQRFHLRPFGSLGRPASLSLSVEELRVNMSLAPELQRGFGLLLQSHSLLFIGSAPETLEQVLQALAPGATVSGGRHLALVPADPANDVWAATLEKFGVRLLSYPAANNHAALRDFVDQLASELKSVGQQRKAPGGAGRPPIHSGQIKKLTLTNVGLFDSLELDFPNSGNGAAEGRPWTVIFGGNGVGKSSVLRAIALALIGGDAAAQPTAQRMLKAGEKQGMIELQLGGETVLTELVRDGSTVQLKSRQTTPVEAGVALVLGFPSLRGPPTPNPTGVTPQAYHGPEPGDLLPLVTSEVDGRLGGFKQWLVNLLVQAGNGGDERSVRLLGLINNIIRDIVPGEIDSFAPLDLSTYVIRVRTPEGDVPFDDLSQGMSSIFNWLGVLVRRLYDIYADSPAPEKEPAIVLIDEIDAHLHPDWQRRLVELTKRYFPLVQVIATSHSPLLAGALHAHEMCVLERDPATGKVGRLPYEIDLYGLRAQDILTSPVFALETDRNPEVDRLRRAYFDLFERVERSPEDEARLAQLAEELAHYKYFVQPTARPAPASLPAEMDDKQALEVSKRLAMLDAVADPEPPTGKEEGDDLRSQA